MNDRKRGNRGSKLERVRSSGSPGDPLGGLRPQGSSWQSDDSEAPRKRARRVDLDSAPEGYDANVWELAIHFETKAEAEGWILATGRPVIYAALARKLQSMGWLSTGVIRQVHLDLVHDLVDDFFAREIEHNRARYAIDQFISLLPDMASSFLEEVRVARIKNRPARTSELSEDAVERGERVRAERVAQTEAKVPMVVYSTDRPARPDWEAIKARVSKMKGIK